MKKRFFKPFVDSEFEKAFVGSGYWYWEQVFIAPTRQRVMRRAGTARYCTSLFVSSFISQVLA